MIMYTNLAVALFGASVIMMSTAHIALLIAAAAGGVLLVRRWPFLFYQVDDLILLFSLSFFGLAFMGMGAWHGDLDAMVHLVWPILLVLPIMALLFYRPPRLKWLWGGVACGALLSGGWAVWQSLLISQEPPSYSSAADSILFGNLSLLLCLMSLAGLCWSTQVYRRRTWMVLLSVAAFSGLLASLLSGSLSGFLVLPFALVVLYRGYQSDLPRRWSLALFSALTLLICAFLFLPHAGQNFTYGGMPNPEGMTIDGDREFRDLSDTGTTTNHRVEIWQAAGQVILEQPVQGVGDKGFQANIRARIDQGAIGSGDPSYFLYAHNDVLEAWTKRGLPGVVALLFLYLAPFVLFLNSLSESDPSRRSLAMAGILLAMAYIGFGLTYSFMSHPLAITAYMFWMIVLWTSLRCRPESRHIADKEKVRETTLRRDPVLLLNRKGQ